MILLALQPRVRAALRRVLGHAEPPAVPEAASSDAEASGVGRPFTADDAYTSVLLFHLLVRVVGARELEGWPDECLEVSRDLHRYFGKQVAKFSSRVPEGIVTLSGLEKQDLNRRLFAAYVLEKAEVVAAWRGREHLPELRLEGAQFLEEALAGGRGAVLWCETSFSASLLIKAAIARGGFSVHHLARAGHNLSNSSFGMRYLNPIVRAGEDRYLAERIMIRRGNGELAVSRRIMELLRENQIVSVTVGNTGAQTVEAPLFDGVLRVATGAPHFALRNGARLLPVFSYREGPEYVVEIGKPIDLEARGREEAYQAAVFDLAGRVEAHARAHPLDWCGWLRGAYKAP